MHRKGKRKRKKKMGKSEKEELIKKRKTVKNSWFER